MSFKGDYELIFIFSETGERDVAVRVRQTSKRKSSFISTAATKITEKIKNSRKNDIAPVARQRIHLLAEQE